jgi:hypothetical protein
MLTMPSGFLFSKVGNVSFTEDQDELSLQLRPDQTATASVWIIFRKDDVGEHQKSSTGNKIIPDATGKGSAAPKGEGLRGDAANETAPPKAVQFYLDMAKSHRFSPCTVSVAALVGDTALVADEPRKIPISITNCSPSGGEPHVADYVHRLCKDVPLFFKFATLRHATTLYADRNKQPTGAQERHDYLPINVDFTLADFKKTSEQLSRILLSYGEKANMSEAEVKQLFRGDGFNRLVLASGGVPRDFLSLLLEVLSPMSEGEERVGKDEVRIMSQAVFQRRIEELKSDSEEQDQDTLLRGIYAIRKFCLDKKFNVFLVADKVLQEQNGVRELLNRLLDYRIIHSVGTALTHKSTSGTFQANMIDIGAYANMRKLAERFMEIDITASDARERCRNAPILDEHTLLQLYQTAPASVEAELLQPAEEVAGNIGNTED